MNYGITTLAAIAIRKDPKEQSEMISQLLYGELYTVLKEEKQWIRISGCYDQYEGWISKNQHHLLTDEEIKNLKESQTRILSSKFAEVSERNKPPFTIVAGSELHSCCIKKNNISLHEMPSDFPGLSETAETPGEKMAKTARMFINTPYLWGGRSAFGCDCSGFVQTVFKIHSIALPRDAAQQFHFGTEVVSLRNAKSSDLVFFKNESQRIHHVGILLSPNEIIHCSGRVRIDHIYDQGIMPDKNNKLYSHSNLMIKRILL